MPTYVFACVANAGRSQMAAAFFNHFVVHSSAQAVSAGTQPAPAVHPEVAAAMQEIGIDLSHAVPRKLTTEVAQGATLLVTMGCGKHHPLLSFT
jgi:arsenate reductase